MDTPQPKTNTEYVLMENIKTVQEAIALCDQIAETYEQLVGAIKRETERQYGGEIGAGWTMYIRNAQLKEQVKLVRAAQRLDAAKKTTLQQLLATLEGELKRVREETFSKLTQHARTTDDEQ